MVSEWEIFNTNRLNAAAGMPDAEFYFGHCFLTGTNVSQDRRQAEKWLCRSAAQGYKEAQLTLMSKFGYDRARIDKLIEDRKVRDRLSAEAGQASEASSNPVDAPLLAGMPAEREAPPVTAPEQTEELTRAERLRSAAALCVGDEKDFQAALRLLAPLLEAGDDIALGMADRIRMMALEGQPTEVPEPVPEAAAPSEKESAARTVPAQKREYGSLREIREAAARGDTDAQFLLGECYYYGRNVDQDYALAVKWYRNAAEGGHAEAACQIGSCYVLGKGVAADPAKASHWFESGAAGGSLSAIYNLGVCYRNGWGVPSDKEKEIECYRKAAEGGNARAQYELGKSYYTGYIKKDLATAHFWLARACNQDVAQALVLLAKLYEDGEGVVSDDGFAFSLLQKAARLGGHEADALLAKYYFRGEYVTRDIDKAAKLARPSAEAGDTVNQMLMSRYCEEKGDDAEAFRWLLASSADQDPASLYELGRYYSEGRGTPPDTVQAYDCYKRAAEAGSVKALIPLANCYKHGLGVGRNPQEAARLAKLYKQQNSKK